MKYCKILCIILINTQLILKSQSLKPIKIQTIGRISKISYSNFNLISPRSQTELPTDAGTSNSFILSNLLKSLPKTQKCIQVLSLNGNGLYEMIVLSEANNFDNKIIIVKQNPQQYVWVNKNIFLNGFQEEQHLYNSVLSDKNQITPYYDASHAINYILERDAPTLEYTIHSTISNLIKHALHTESNLQGKSPTQYRMVQLFVTVHSKRLASVLRQQLQELHQSYKIQLIVQLNIPIPVSLLIPSRWLDSAGAVKISLYKLNVKEGSQKLSIQFKNIKQIYTYSNQNSFKAKNEQRKFLMLEQGIYYATMDHILFATSN